MNRLPFVARAPLRRLAPVALALAALAAADGASALAIALPAESATYRPSALPGYALALQNCLTCHSAQYVQTQPPASPRTYWEATVRKMKKPFGAPVDDADIPAIVDYLSRTYGAEAAGGADPGTQKQ